MVDLEHALLGARYVIQVDGDFAQSQDAIVRDQCRLPVVKWMIRSHGFSYRSALRSRYRGGDNNGE